jgi:hypothetical protein
MCVYARAEDYSASTEDCGGASGGRPAATRAREAGRRDHGRSAGDVSVGVRPVASAGGRLAAAASAGGRPAASAAVRRREHGRTAGDKREKLNCCASVGHWRAAGRASVDRQVERRAADGRPAGGCRCRQLAMDAID